MNGKRAVHLVNLDAPGLVTPEEAFRMRSRVVSLGPGEEAGEHVTTMREELLVPLDGELTFVGPDGEQAVSPGQALYVPEGTVHNVKNRTGTSVRYLYVLALHRDYSEVKRHQHHH